jgi:hypothetical protein
MRLAHLILAHNHPSQLVRLVRSLSSPNADIYIHLDKKADPEEFAAIKTIPNTYFVKKNVRLAWCEYSTIQGTLNGMEQILATGITYSHINLLSGNDYPLQNAADIQEFLFSNPDKTYMWYDLIFNDWQDGQRRMKKYCFGDYGFRGRYIFQALANMVLPDRRLPKGLKAYGRSQWLTITPACAAYVIYFIKANPSVERFFRMTWAVDEVFFQTILCNSPSLRKNIVNDNLRYIVLNEEYRPKTLTIADAETLTASGKFYGRKFDSHVDSAILDHLTKKQQPFVIS